MSARDEVLARVRRAKGARAAPPVPREYRAAGTRGAGDVELFAERLRDYRARVRVVGAGEVAAAVAEALRERGARHVVTAPGTPPEWTRQWVDEAPGALTAPELSDLGGRVESRVPLGGDPREALPGDAEVGQADAGHATPGRAGIGNAGTGQAAGSQAGTGQAGTQDPAAGGVETGRTAEPEANPEARTEASAETNPEARTEAVRVEVVGGPVDVTSLERADAVLTACHVAVAETGTIVLDHDAPDQGPRALTLVPDYHLVVVRADQVVAGVPDAVAALAGVRTQTWISGPSATSDIELERVEGVHGPRTLEVVIVR